MLKMGKSEADRIYFSLLEDMLCPKGMYIHWMCWARWTEHQAGRAVLSPALFTPKSAAVVPRPSAHSPSHPRGDNSLGNCVQGENPLRNSSKRPFFLEDVARCRKGGCSLKLLSVATILELCCFWLLDFDFVKSREQQLAFSDRTVFKAQPPAPIPHPSLSISTPSL